MNKPEINPFEMDQVAQEWIRSIEWEKWLIRDKEIYPFLDNWASKCEWNLVEIGSWQWICSTKIPNFKWKYIWIEPSIPLVTRANLLYPDSSFIVWNAYSIPLPCEYADNCFSINVWFHLKQIDLASKELVRILKQWWEFVIITANPHWYKSWIEFYENPQIEWNMMLWKVKVPVNPLSLNTFYFHTFEEIIFSLENAWLAVESSTEFWELNWENIFITIKWVKNR